MAGATGRIPMSRRVLMCDNFGFEDSGESEMRLADSVFGFLDEHGEGSGESTSGSDGYGENNKGMDKDEEEEEEEEEEGEKERNGQDDKSFWENQHQLLNATLCRTTSLESRIRNATKQALKEAQMAGNSCVCQGPDVAAAGCRSCLMREISGRLQSSGFNSAICKSKWRSSPDIPSGEHSFLDVVDNSSSKKGEIRVIIELNFRAEFEVARAREEYKQLIRRLPEVFVGKVERLANLIKVLCSAAKKCMRENKMHMGPWRKQKYMKAKWLRTCERTTTTATAASSVLASPGEACSGPPPRRRRTSMLTLDLLDGLHRTAVEVL